MLNAFPWQFTGDASIYRFDEFGNMVGKILKFTNPEIYDVYCQATNYSRYIGSFTNLEAAKAEADKELIRLGYRLIPDSLRNMI